MEGFAIGLIIAAIVVVLFLVSGVGQKSGGGSKNQKLGVIGLIVMLFGILGLTNYVKNLDNLL